MKTKLLVIAIILSGLQARAASQTLIECIYNEGLTRSRLVVTETSLGRYQTHIVQYHIDTRHSYTRTQDVDRSFSGSKPAMTFAKNGVSVFHIFGAQVYTDSNVSIQFPDAGCFSVSPDDRGLIVGFAQLELKSCETDTAKYEAQVREEAFENAERQCPYRMIEVLQEIKVESFCKFQGKGNFYARAAGLFKCEIGAK